MVQARGENVSTGVCLRVEPGIFRVFPYANGALEPFKAAVRVLNPEPAVKLCSAAVHSNLATLPVSSFSIPTALNPSPSFRSGPGDTNSSIKLKNKNQALDFVWHLGVAEKQQHAVFIVSDSATPVFAPWTQP